MRILTSNLRRAWSPVRLPKQWMPQGAQPVSHSWIRHLYHLVNRQDHPAWRFCQRRKLQVSKTTFLPANLVDLWFVLLCSHFSVMPWWTFVRPKVPLVRLSAELLFGTPIFLEPEPQALKVNIHQSRFQRCTISIHFCLFCLVHLCPVFKFQIFNLCRESEKVTCFFSFLILESWRIPSCWRHLCFVGSTLQWFAYFILFSFSTSSIMSTRSLWPLKFSFLWCIFFKFQQNSRHYGSMTAGFVLKTHLATAERDIGRRRDGHLWYCTRTWLGSAVIQYTCICSVFPETCQIETECVKVQSLKALAVRVQLNRHEKVEDKGVKRSAVHISIFLKFNVPYASIWSQESMHSSGLMLAMALCTTI